MSQSDQARLEREKLQQLLDASAELLESDLSGFMDSTTYSQLTRMHDLVEAWLQGTSALTHEQMFAEIAILTESLSAVNPSLLQDESPTRH